MKRQKFVYNAHAGENTNFVYIPKMEQKANFVYKELYAIVSKRYIRRRSIPNGKEYVKSKTYGHVIL